MFDRFLLLVLLWASTLAAQQPAAEPRTLRYTVTSNGVTNGSEVDVYAPDGHVESAFEFNDRGRGPKITASYWFNGNGLPVRTDVTGVDYLKAPVNEHFMVEEGRAHWQSTSENATATMPGFYLSVNGPPAEIAFLMAALMKAKNGPINLFPGGEARLERVGDVTLTGRGQKMHVTEYALTGISYTPVTLWLDDDHHFFGAPGKWGAVMRSGWEEANQQLYDLQMKADDARDARLSHDLGRRPAKPFAIEHVRVFDSERAVMLEDQTVIVKDDRIAQIGPSPTIHPEPWLYERMYGINQTLLPGLFDMHAHVGPSDGMLNIASGVTSVRDMGNDIEDLRHLKTQWDTGAAIGPRVSRAGLIDGPGPFQAPTGLYADNVTEARAAVNRYAGLGYVQIKLYSSLKPELVAPIVSLAHQRGMRVSGHVPNGMTASQFVESGADELQHMNFVFLNFFAPLVKDTRTPERFTAVGEHAAGLDLGSKAVDDFIELLLKHGTVVDPTLATFEGMFTGRPGQLSRDYEAVIDRLPAQVQRGAYTGGLPVTKETDQLYKDSYDAMLRMAKRLYDAGVPILAGTDATAGIMLHRELELEVQAGIPPLKALQIATWNAARLLKQDQEVGSLRAGKKADWVLVDGNPQDKISDIRRCRLVMKNGVLYKSADVYGAVGIKPAP